MFIAVLFLICYIPTAYKVFASEDNKSICNNTADDAVYYLLKAANQDMSKDYYISEQFEIKKDAKKGETIAFVFDEKRCVGEILSSCSKGGYVFLQEKCGEITDIFKDKKKVAVIRIDSDHICVQCENSKEVLCLYGTFENMEQFQNIADQYIEISLRHLVFDGDEKKGEKAVIDENKLLNVPLIANDTSPDTQDGLCWAASILSIVKYSCTTSITTALGLYNSLKAAFNPEYNGYPEGIPMWEERAFNLLNYSITNYDYSIGMSFSYVKSIIDSGKPIFAGLFANSTQIEDHGVVVCGYSRFSNTGLITYYYYTLMDPNSSNYVIVAVPGTGTNFTYGSYYIWGRHYY